MIKRDFKITKAEEGSAFAVYVVPKSKKTEVVGKYGDALRVNLAFPMVDGKANDILLTFLAQKLKIETHQIEVAAGRNTAEKMVVVIGLTPGETEERLLA
ncbi:MAG: DUF167 domain-containing protein [Chloroflexi bacterium]|nr:MAG: DUF167 domain-containing protein [Chloroflexota bacterium]